MCFAAVDEGEVEPISRRMVDGFRAFWDISREREIDDILRDDEEGVVEEVRMGECAALTGFC